MIGFLLELKVEVSKGGLVKAIVRRCAASKDAALGLSSSR